jgi:cell division GTPase FtsZ
MVFITAGMGGGTGTGAASVIAKIAKDIGILTVGVVTKPFAFEGAHRGKAATKGIEELQQYVDTLLVIPNQNLFRLATETTTFADAFKMADDVLYSGVRGVTDLMVMPGLINLDFADIRTVMSEMGKAMMGTGEAEGDRRALDAAEAAISNPLLDDVSLQGASGVLINITGGYDMTLYEVDEAANRIREEVEADANIIFGSTFDERMSGRIRVSVVATGIGGVLDISFRNRGSAEIIGMMKNDMHGAAFNQAGGMEAAEGAGYHDGDGYHDEAVYNEETEAGGGGTVMLGRPVNRPKRKSASFFERFTSRGRNSNRGEEEEPYIPSVTDKLNGSDQYQKEDIHVDLEKDIEIPSCFRRKER